MAESYFAYGTQKSSSAERYQAMLHVSAETLKSEESAESTKNNKDEITAVTPDTERGHISH